MKSKVIKRRKSEPKDQKKPPDATPANEKRQALIPAEEKLPAAPPPEEEDSDPLSGLSTKQTQAVMHLTCGKSIFETAALVGVNPSTVHRWHHNLRFRSVLNGKKRRVLEVSQSLLVAVSLKAAENVSEEILEGDASLSFKLLDKLGVLSPPEFQSEDHVALGSKTLQEGRIKNIGEGGLAALGELFFAIEEDQGEARRGIEKILESSLDPDDQADEDEDDDEVG